MSWTVPPPEPPPWYLRPFLWLAEKIAGQPLVPARVLSWYPKAAVGAGLLEAFVAHGGDDATGRELSTRLLKLVRLRVSFALHCPFCIEMNGAELDQAGITPDEVRTLQRGDAELDRFSPAERAALVYADHGCRAPLVFPENVTQAVADHFTPRQIVILATTIAQVNYWGRMIQALGLPPIGAGDACEVPEPS